MRIGGIASGIDTETIIRDLMKVERMPLDRFFQKKQTLEWQRDAYRDMNLKLKNLHDAASSIRLRSSLNTRETTVADPQILSATANSSVRNGTYDVNVTQIAKAERYVSTAEIANLDMNAEINTADFGEGFSITTYDNAGVANTKEFTTANKSLNDVFKEINNSDLGVKAFYDSTFKKVVIERKDTGIRNTNGEGNGSEIQFGDLAGGVAGDSQKFLSQLNIDVAVKDQSAANASYSYTDPILGTQNFVDIKSNQTTVGGLSLNLQAVGSTSITVTSNTDDAFEKIKSFVETYNEIIGTIQTKVSEKVNRGFPPLTDEQRKELSEKEAELWDEKAKSGLLSREQTLSSALTKMRQDLYAPVSSSGQYNQIAQIGITTTSNFREGGKLEIDETKLRTALAEDPDSVHQLFNNIAAEGATDQEAYEQTGLIGRLRTTINDTIKKVEDRAGNQYRTNQQFTLGRDLINVDKQIDRFQRRLSDIENRYWSQFTAMEKAMQRANAQGSALMQQLGMGGQY